VSFVHGGKTHWVSATKEVILSAGCVLLVSLRRSARVLCRNACSAIKTPQLLELSGIGGAVHLARLGVEPKVDLPSVGENVQEHVFNGVTWGAA
jgi:choline dehydrogenase-like flavoprotein